MLWGWAACSQEGISSCPGCSWLVRLSSQDLLWISQAAEFSLLGYLAGTAVHRTHASWALPPPLPDLAGLGRQAMA